MYGVWVTVEVIAERREEFLQAIADNARISVRDEEHCLRFDVLELGDGSNRFAFYELYRDEEAFKIGHLQAPHYLAYREAAQGMLVPGSQTMVTGRMLNSFA
ncbi:MAG TPA: putative quinol monooxygenase [Arthrobacter sp.]|nr:putative quinol monooxygenase [Arthrobacter sp.]